MSQATYGTFGNLVEHYQRARQPYSDDVMDYCMTMLSQMPDGSILDVGCGTGISTRQLARYGRPVIGLDIDERMLEEARKASHLRVEYRQASVEAIPFDREQMAAVTAFASFHWFRESARALQEIRRVLKPGGPFIAINKQDHGVFRPLLRQLVERYVSDPLPDIKALYRPEVMADQGFLDVTRQDIPSRDVYTMEGLLEFVRSNSLWNLVPVDAHKAFLADAQATFQPHLKRGVFTRFFDVTVVVGWKGKM